MIRTAVVIGATCTACGMCLATCPEHALRAAPRRPAVDAWSCTGCLECVEVCPVDAIAESRTAPEDWTATADGTIAGWPR